MFSPRGKKSQDTAESSTSTPQFLGKLCLCEFLEATDTPGCSSSLQTLAPLTGAFISIHLLEWFLVCQVTAFWKDPGLLSLFPQKGSLSRGKTRLN